MHAMEGDEALFSDGDDAGEGQVDMPLEPQFGVSATKHPSPIKSLVQRAAQCAEEGRKKGFWRTSELAKLSEWEHIIHSFDEASGTWIKCRVCDKTITTSTRY